MKRTLWESIKRPFLNSKKNSVNSKYENNPSDSSTVSHERTQQKLDDSVPVGFFDNSYNSYSVKSVQEQRSLILTYRELAERAELSDAISEIVDEATFNPSGEILSLDYSSKVPQNLKTILNDELDDICARVKLPKNIYTLFKSFYVDGQLNIHCKYNNDKIEDGIKEISVISPIGLNFNYSKNIWEYDADIEFSDNFHGHSGITSPFFDREEIIRIDSGVYKNNMILSNLHPAIKPSNMLTTLEDMLIPIRFTRSVSRRVFNVDVSNISPKKAEEVMRKNQVKFKYKKFYNVEKGTISDQQHITSLTEDYWFANRGGEKGTTVDTIDETGNLGELDDILYIQKKLYSTLNVPSDRLNNEGEFDYEATSISREELKFFNFISRLRNQFLELFVELLKRQLIAKNIMNIDEFDELMLKTRIKFNTENKFFEKMEREKLTESLNLYEEMEDLTGKYFSYRFMFKKVLKFSDKEIKEMLDEIEKEKKDGLYKGFYTDID